MLFRKIRLIVLLATLALAALWALLGLLGPAAPAAARGEERAVVHELMLAPRALPEPKIDYTVATTDPCAGIPNCHIAPPMVAVLDSSGNPVGEGTHVGLLQCKDDNCSREMTLALGGVEYEYKFASRQAHDPTARIVVVAGTGTRINERPKERFSFTAVFEDNGDGTFSATYTASRPDASFILPATPGSFEISSR